MEVVYVPVSTQNEILFLKLLINICCCSVCDSFLSHHVNMKPMFSVVFLIWTYVYNTRVVKYLHFLLQFSVKDFHLFACDDTSQSNLWSVLTFNMCISPIVYKFHVSHVFDPFGQFIFPCFVFTSMHCHHVICCQIISVFSYCVAVTSKPMSGFT